MMLLQEMCGVAKNLSGCTAAVFYIYSRLYNPLYQTPFTNENIIMPSIHHYQSPPPSHSALQLLYQLTKTYSSLRNRTWQVCILHFC